MCLSEEVAQDGTPSMFNVNAPLLISGGTFNQFVNGHDSNSRKAVHMAFKNHIAHSATSDTFEVPDPPRCHPKTRLAILTKLSQWVSNTSRSPHLLWLFGPAGAGKSAIARSLAELLSNSGQLGGTFFFLRTADARNNARLLVTTLAYSLALAHPEFLEAISNTVETFVNVFHASLETQMNRLIVGPALSLPSGPHMAVIVDGLDECGDRDVQCRIIKLFADAATRLNGRIKFLIFSRPEHHIEATFKMPKVNNITLAMNVQDDLHTYDDIILFLRDKFEEIRQSHPLKETLASTPWPLEEDVDELMRRSSGNFIYPQTVMKYIEVPYHRPQERLRTILDLSPSDDSPYGELDSLYHFILSSARTDRATLLRILGTMTVFRGDSQNIALACSTRFQERILSLLPGDITLKLLDLKSLITFESYIPKHPQITFPSFLHTSLFDFLLDPARSREFHIDNKAFKIDIARAILSFLEKSVYDLANVNERIKCDCASKLLCDHKWDIFYNALSWLSFSQFRSWTEELEQTVLRHNITPVYDLMLDDYIENDIEILLGAHAIPVLYLGVLEFSVNDKPKIHTQHHSDYEGFLVKALNKYHNTEDSLLDTILTLISSLGTHEFSFPELDVIRRCIAIFFLYHTTYGLPTEEQSNLLLEINGAQDLRLKFQMVINKLKRHATGPLYKALLFTERVMPFENEYSAARHLARFLCNPDASGEYYCDVTSLRRATAYCLDFVCARFPALLDNLYHFCQIIRKLLIMQLYRESPLMQDDDRSIYLPTLSQPSDPPGLNTNDLLARFMALTSDYCKSIPTRTNLIGVEYIDSEEFKIFWDLGGAFLTLSELSEPIDKDPMTPCLVTLSRTFPSYESNELFVISLDETGILS